MRPVWYHVTREAGSVAHVYANGNPFLYWAFLPAVAWVGWIWRRRHYPALIVLLIGFLGQWLPWALVPRIAYAYHFLPSAIFGCLAVAVCVADLRDRGRALRILAVGYVLIVVLGFTFFYPIHSAVPLSREAFELRMWFDSWR
jgi:dolichyl-phosphate-mannose--protein O-mannosyl transferase